MKLLCYISGDQCSPFAGGMLDVDMSLSSFMTVPGLVLWQMSPSPRMPFVASAVGGAWLRSQGRVQADEKQENQGACGSEICFQRGQPAWLPGTEVVSVRMGARGPVCCFHALLHKDDQSAGPMLGLCMQRQSVRLVASAPSPPQPRWQ